MAQKPGQSLMMGFKSEINDGETKWLTKRGESVMVEGEKEDSDMYMVEGEELLGEGELR